jgi:RHS repeat-associated protein
MQARPYRPDVGRFLTQDRFESGSGDLALQSDPMMSNRYTFAGANPVNNIEFDGHKSCTATCRAGEHQQAAGGDVQKIRGKRDPRATGFTGSVGFVDLDAAVAASKAETVPLGPPRPFLVCGGRVCALAAVGAGDSRSLGAQLTHSWAKLEGFQCGGSDPLGLPGLQSGCAGVGAVAREVGLGDEFAAWATEGEIAGIAATGAAGGTGALRAGVSALLRRLAQRATVDAGRSLGGGWSTTGRYYTWNHYKDFVEVSLP